MTNVASPLEHLVSEPSDEPGRINGDRNVRQREEEDHDIVWNDIVSTNSTIMHLLATDGKSGQEEEVSRQWRGNEIDWEVKPFELCATVIVVCFGRWNDSRSNDESYASPPYWQWNWDGNVEREENDNVYSYMSENLGDTKNNA